MTSPTPSPISDQAAGEHIDIVFDQVAVDGAPPEYSFIEVENSQRASIKFGEWIHRDDGYWVLRISTAPTTGSAPVAWVVLDGAGEVIRFSLSEDYSDGLPWVPLIIATPATSAPVAYMHRNAGPWDLSFADDEGKLREVHTKAIPLYDTPPASPAASVPEAEWITKLRRELMMSKMTHNFTFSRNEVIEMLGGQFALLAASMGGEKS